MEMDQDKKFLLTIVSTILGLRQLGKELQTCTKFKETR